VLTSLDGWLHDKYNITTMVRGETFLDLGFVIISLFDMYQLKLKKITETN